MSQIINFITRNKILENSFKVSTEQKNKRHKFLRIPIVTGKILVYYFNFLIKIKILIHRTYSAIKGYARVTFYKYR